MKLAVVTHVGRRVFLGVSHTQNWGWGPASPKFWDVLHTGMLTQNEKQPPNFTYYIVFKLDVRMVDHAPCPGKKIR